MKVKERLTKENMKKVAKGAGLVVGGIAIAMITKKVTLNKVKKEVSEGIDAFIEQELEYAEQAFNQKNHELLDFNEIGSNLSEEERLEQINGIANMGVHKYLAKTSMSNRMKDKLENRLNNI